MTNQEAFDIALKGIRGQGYRRSLTTEGYCAYRGTDGLKCAVVNKYGCCTITDMGGEEHELEVTVAKPIREEDLE